MNANSHLHRSLQIETQPFGRLISSESREKYTNNWATMITYIVASFDHPDKDRRFMLQENQASAVIELARCSQNVDVPEEDRLAALLNLTYTLIAHEFDDADIGAESHPIIATVILQNINRGNIFAAPENVSPYLASVQYMMRTTIVLKIYEQAKARRAGQEQGKRIYSSTKVVNRTLHEEMQWLKEGPDTPFDWVRRTQHLTAGHALVATRLPRFVGVRGNSQAFRFDGHHIEHEWVINLMKANNENLHRKFLKLWTKFGIPLNLLVEETDFGDDLSNRAANYSFLNFGPNQQLRDRADLIRKTVLNNGKLCNAVNGKLYWNTGFCKELLEDCEDVSKDEAATTYLSGGQPPRGTELLGVTGLNSPSRPRNTYIIDGHMVFVIFFNKTTFIHGIDKPIPRALPLLLSSILINHIAFIRPLEHILTRHVLRMSRQQAAKCHSHLFFVNGRELETHDLTNRLMATTKEHLHLPKGLGTADMRQLLIYFGMRVVRTEQDTEIDRSILDLQAGHLTEIAKRWYGVELGRFPGNIDPSTVAAFMDLSFAHHTVYQINDTVSILGNKVCVPSSMWISWQISM